MMMMTKDDTSDQISEFYREKQFEVECSTTWTHLISSVHRILGRREEQKIIIFLDIGSSSSDLFLHEEKFRYVFGWKPSL